MRQFRMLMGFLSLPVIFTACSLWIMISRTTSRFVSNVQTREDVDGSARDRRSTQPPLVNFSSNLELEQYAWTQMRLDRQGHRLAEPGSARVDRPVAAGHEAAEIQRVLQRAAHRLRNETADPGYSAADCLGGRRRFLLGLGDQYEVYFRDRTAAAAPSGGASAAAATAADSAAADSAAADDSEAADVNYHTVRLHRPLGGLQVEYVGRTTNRLVHVLLPYFNRLAALEAFLAQFTQLASGHQPLALTLVRFSEGLPAMNETEEREDRSAAEELVATALQALGSDVPRVRLLEAEGRFSAGAGWLAAAAATSKEDNIVMLAHVDLLFGVRFLQRCRANTRPGKQVYYPMAFSMYNPLIAYGVYKKHVHSVRQNYDRKRLLDADLGYWLEADYSVSCQYLSDFRGFSGGHSGPGLEVLLYERYVESSMDLIRMPDPDLVLVYRKVTCLKEMGRKEYNACLKTKAMNEASQMEWGLWVFKNLGDTDDVKKFVEMVKKSGLELPTPKS